MSEDEVVKVVLRPCMGYLLGNGAKVPHLAYLVDEHYRSGKVLDSVGLVDILEADSAFNVPSEVFNSHGWCPTCYEAMHSVHMPSLLEGDWMKNLFPNLRQQYNKF